MNNGSSRSLTINHQSFYKEDEICQEEMEQDRQEQDQELVEEWVVQEWGAGRAVAAWAVLALAPEAVVYARVAGKKLRTKWACRVLRSNAQVVALL